ncbi:hypothetical protein TWF102_011200 [Orbilia oligospora]|uniref:PD-(D/E)XK nuclease-like domain-containing protein n=1 Tax=Orbilia oligospora TaxID=2813651 RepID=A0A7C8JE35_ORBOL|nr:hypothetical protein TWF706_001133 [Orbilia oligospora]KAF3085943.1 hypothetical protein TWF102_011200 [Orbilia oligospora]KAF3098764.1 hypothetical protein TWF103_008918 [Orbilia oligospora]
MAHVHPEEGPIDLHEVIMAEQLEASFTIQETLTTLERPNSPTKRKFSLASHNEASVVSYRDPSTRRLAEPISRLDSTKQPGSRNSSPEKRSTRSQSRNSSPDKQSESLITQFPDYDFPPSLFSDSPRYGVDFVDHVISYCEHGLGNYGDDATESAWSHMAKNLLDGLSKGRLAPLQVTGIESNTLHPSILPMKMPSLRSDIVIHANQFFNSRFRQLRRQIKYPPIAIDQTFSPFTHPDLRNTPAFAVIEVKAGCGDLQEAQMQAGVVGGAILRKARQIGASVEAVPCVPAVVAFGATWYLHLTYDEPDLIVTSTPWIIGDTITFLGALKIVLFIEQLRTYAQDTWWKLFVDGSCSDLLERFLKA